MESSYTLRLINRPKDVTMKDSFNERTGKKYMAGTMTQNFFRPNEDTEDYTNSSQQFQVSARSHSNQESSRRVRSSRKKFEEVKLQPMKQMNKVDIYQSVQFRNNPDDIDQIFISTPPMQIQSKPRALRKIHRPVHQIERTVLKNSNFTLSQKKEQIQKKIDLAESQLLFDELQEVSKEAKHQQKVQKQEKKAKVAQQQTFNVPKRSFAHEYHDEEESEEQQKKKEDEKMQLRQKIEQDQFISYVIGSEYFNFNDRAEYVKSLFADVTAKTTLSMEIIRDKSGLNTFWPEFHLQFVKDQHHVISAKKTSSKFGSTFIISLSKQNFEEDSQYYLGKIKSDAIGEVFNIYGPGVNPKSAKVKRVAPREMLASVVYSTALFHKGGPRKFQVFLKNPELDYNKDFLQIKLQDEEIALNTLHSYSDNKQKIRILKNRKPKWVENGDGYILDFRGKAECLSVKNFILQHPQNGSEIVLFGKSKQNRYNLEVSTGISSYLAFAIAISSFENRLLFE